MTTPSQPRWPNPGPDGRLKEKHLPAHLGQSNLNATYVPSTVGPHPELFGARAAMANAASEAVDVLTLGDSLWEGMGASSGAKRMPIQLQRELNRRFGTNEDPGDVFLPLRMSANVPAPTEFWTLTGTPGTNGQGPGGRSGKLNTGNAVQGTFSGGVTKFRLFVYRLAADQVRITIDGGTPVDWTVPVVTGKAQQVWESPALTAGTHTFRVEFLAGGPIFAGVEVIRSGKGIRVWDLSISGMSAKTKISASNGTNDWANWLGTGLVVPELILLPLLTNDATASTSAEYEASMRSLVDMIRAKTAAPILIIPNWGPVAATPLSPWPEYVAAAEKVARESTRVAFHDLNREVDDPAGNPHGIHSDSVHLNDRGQMIHARLVADAITRT